jgi:hypothetical protein
VRRLNSDKVPSPINYAVANGLEGNYNRGNGLWSSRTVKDILSNKAYIGDLEQGTEKYLTADTHEPLIDRETFSAVQELISSSTGSRSNITNIPRSDNILRGKVICGSCGSKMQRRKGSGKAEWHFFSCISNNRLGAGHCVGMYVRESDIMDAVYTEISNYIATNEHITHSYLNQKAALENKIATIVDKLHNSEDDLRKRYEDFVSGAAGLTKMETNQEIDAALKKGLTDYEAQFESLEQLNEQHLLFRDVLDGKREIGEAISIYLKNVVVYTGKTVKVCIGSSVA